MDTTINPISAAASQQYAVPAAKTATNPAASAVPDTKVPAVEPADAASKGATSATSQQQYETALYQASLSFKNSYAVSDQEFSIFKDATGKYITRYVSLRDGKVTYTPEPTLVKQLQLGGAVSTSARVAISA